MQGNGESGDSGGRKYLDPDYSCYPREEDEYENDYIEEVDEGEIELEKKLEEQEALQRRLDEEEEERRSRTFYRPMNENQETPFNTGNWGRRETTERAPWENDKGSSGSRYSFGGGGSFGGYSGGNNRTSPSTGFSDIRELTRKKIIICDFMDCLFESWAAWEESGRQSHTRPGIQPRGIFDLKPKFEVWDKIASFDPERIFIIFPATKYINAFRGDEGVKRTVINYVTAAVASYLRIDIDRCIVLDEKKSFKSKEKSLLVAINACRSPERSLYIGVYSGRYGLSSKDLDAAKSVKIDYMDVTNLIDGKYEFE